MSNKTAKAPKAPKTAKNPEASAEKRAATVAKNRSAKIQARGYALPLVLTCRVTGKQVKYTSPTYIDKVIAKYGSLEKLQSDFTSREGRRLEKPAKVATPAPAAAPAEAPAQA